MRLDRVIKDSGCVAMKGCGHIEVSSVCDDSRKVVHGSLFVAVKGYTVDGHEYISRAIGKAQGSLSMKTRRLLTNRWRRSTPTESFS